MSLTAQSSQLQYPHSKVHCLLILPMKFFPAEHWRCVAHLWMWHTLRPFACMSAGLGKPPVSGWNWPMEMMWLLRCGLPGPRYPKVWFISQGPVGILGLLKNLPLMGLACVEYHPWIYRLSFQHPQFLKYNLIHILETFEPVNHGATSASSGQKYVKVRSSEIPKPFVQPHPIPRNCCSTGHGGWRPTADCRCSKRGAEHTRLATGIRTPGAWTSGQQPAVPCRLCRMILEVCTSTELGLSDIFDCTVNRESRGYKLSFQTIMSGLETLADHLSQSGLVPTGWFAPQADWYA